MTLRDHCLSAASGFIGIAGAATGAYVGFEAAAAGAGGLGGLGGFVYAVAGVSLGVALAQYTDKFRPSSFLGMIFATAAAACIVAPLVAGIPAPAESSAPQSGQTLTAEGLGFTLRH